MKQEYQSIRDQLLSKLNSAHCPVLSEEEQEFEMWLTNRNIAPPRSDGKQIKEIQGS
jgi:hypothetical protein